MFITIKEIGSLARVLRVVVVYPLVFFLLLGGVIFYIRFIRFILKAAEQNAREWD